MYIPSDMRKGILIITALLMTKTKTTITYLMVVITILFLSCTSKQQSEVPTGEMFDEANLPAAEKLIWKAMNVYDSQLILKLTDSLENTGDISAITAYQSA